MDPSKVSKMFAMYDTGKKSIKPKKPGLPAKKTAAITSEDRQSMKYSELQQYFELQRKEHVAAKRIQKFWRKSQSLIPWRHAYKCQIAARRIQQIVRGVLTRIRVARWVYTRSKVITDWQAHTRRYVSNLHLRPVLFHEKKMVIRIQRIVRGKLARLRCQQILCNLVATRIQALWRGVLGRAKSDKIWLNRVVVPVQKNYRQRLALRYYGKERSLADYSATIIQKKFRSWLSIRRLGKALFDREMEYRMRSIKLLTSEEELAQEKLMKLMNRLLKNDYKSLAEKSMKELIRAQEAVHIKENTLIELIKQLEILSPRAMEQGWKEELEKNVKSTREELTTMKTKVLFEMRSQVHSNESRLEDLVGEIEECSDVCRRVARWRDQEYDERRHLTYQKDILQMRKEKRIAVADERRKWQVLFFTKNGKPDKKRRPGKPWDKSVYAGPEKAVYTAGFGVDLLAHTKPASDLKKGSNASVEHTLGEVSLQTYLEQVNQYEQLLNPLLKIMEKNFGNASGDKPIEERGWGPEGVKLSEALEGIGALSPEFQRQKPAKKSKSFRRSNTLRNTGRMVLFNSDKQHGLLSTDASLCLEDSNAQVSNMEPSKSDVSTRYGGDGSFQATSSARSRNVIASDSDFRRSRSAMTASSDMDNQVVPFNDDVKDHYAIGEYNNKRLSKPSAAVLSAREYAEKRATKRKERKEREAKRRNPAVIPWQLLDQLDGERKKFENEKAYIEFHQKF